MLMEIEAEKGWKLIGRAGAGAGAPIWVESLVSIWLYFS